MLVYHSSDSPLSWSGPSTARTVGAAQVSYCSKVASDPLAYSLWDLGYQRLHATPVPRSGWWPGMSSYLGRSEASSAFYIPTQSEDVFMFKAAADAGHLELGLHPCALTVDQATQGRLHF